MDRLGSSTTTRMLALMLAIVSLSGLEVANAQIQAFSRTTAKRAATQAQYSHKQVAAKKTPAQKLNKQPAANSIVDPSVDEAFAWNNYLDDTCCGDCCDVNCGNRVNCRCGKPVIYAGVEAVMVKPRFESNVAFTVRDGDGTFFNFSETEFDYDTELTPRVYVGWRHQDGVGLRATWWQFDHGAATATASPPDSTSGLISNPVFGDVDISINDPDDVYSATTALNTYAIDLEATKQASFSSWDLGIGCGVRYASTKQNYFAQTRNDSNTLLGQIDYRHALEGIGPTISLEAYRSIATQFDIFGKARGSVLFGDGESRLNAGEDLDLANPFTTVRTTHRDDLLSIAEIQLGFRWQASPSRGKSFRPFIAIALEGQVWNGAGNATSEEGTLGFFGMNSAVGTEW